MLSDIFMDSGFIMPMSGLKASGLLLRLTRLSEEKIERLLKDLQKARRLLQSAERRLNENYEN